MSYYHGLISSKRANAILNERGNGTFLIRDSQSQPGCFVLSAKSAGKVYHVLIFHKGGQYSLDIAGEEDTPALFSSLDDLVVFCMSHQMKMEGDKVSLKEVIHCDDELSTNDDFPTLESNGSHPSEDTSLLTDLYPSLFGTQCSVVSMGHNPLNFAGQPLEEGQERLVVLVRDRPQKAFFIKVVDTQERKVVGEKRVDKNFQYDTPGDLVITFLSEHGITCIGFRDTQEKETFCHQLDRVVCWLSEKAERQRERVVDGGERKKKGRVADGGKKAPKPNEFTSKIKAEDFDINHLSPEWQYLFDMAGVTRPMLTDKATLQFILDMIQKIGGAPHNLETVQEEAVDPENAGSPKRSVCGEGVSGGGVHVEMRKERMKVLAVEHALRRETQRASQLSQELKRLSIKGESPTPLSPGCTYKRHCESFKDYLMVRHTLVAIGPEKGSCYCQQCVAGKPLVQVAGSPPQQYSLPLGWCRFVHRSQTHVLAQQFLSRWHVAYCSVATTRVAGVMRTGQLPTTHSTGEVILSPDIQTACIINPVTPMSYEDDLSGQHFKVRSAFQVYVQPGSYSVDAVAVQSNSPSQSQLAWTAQERTYIVHALLVQMIPVTH
jgi:hypothetical protein